MFAEILERKRQPVANVVVDGIGNEHPSRLGQRFEPRRDIHPIAENVVFLNDHVAEVDADVKSDALFLSHLGLALGHAALDLHGAPHGIHDALELRQQAVAGVLYDPASVLAIFGLTSSRNAP